MSPWRTAERAYYGHHAACGPCKGAGQVNGTHRCQEGQQLWEAYISAPLPKWLEGASRPAPQPFQARR